MTHIDQPDAVRRTIPANAVDRARPKGVLERQRSWVHAALRDLAYLAAVFAWSVASFCILVSGVSVTVSLIVLVVGVAFWVGFTRVLRWTTSVDRALAGWQRREPVRASHREPESEGFAGIVKTVTADPQTWREMAWLGINSVVGFALGLVAITAAGLVMAYVSMPLWFWAVTDPQSEYGLTNLGRLTVDTPGEALATTALGIVLSPLVLLLARGIATFHASLAARVLGDPAVRP